MIPAAPFAPSGLAYEPHLLSMAKQRLRWIYWAGVGWGGRVMRRLRASLGIRPRRMTAGIGQGLRFDPGASNPDYASGTNELPVQRALAQHLRAGDVFYDVGANVGFFTVLAARLVTESGHVYAFEPVPRNAALIRRNVRLNGLTNVTVVEQAVARASGSGELRLARYAGGAALATVAPPPDTAGVITVTLTSLDDVIRRAGYRAPRLVKIDVEGAEAEVLDGMSWTMREIRPLIVCEIDDEQPAAFRHKRVACEAILRAAGYRTTVLEDSYPDIRWLVGHVLATPRECAAESSPIAEGPTRG